MASAPVEIEANCAICGAPPYPECPHEGERLEQALNQAMERWEGMQRIRAFALDHARNAVITTFQQLKAIRLEHHHNYLQTLPCYTLYHRYNGHPPLQPAQLQLVHSQIQQANHILQQGVDQDWRTSCMEYPKVLDYYLNLAVVIVPDESHPALQDPRFGPAPQGPVARRVKDRRDSVDMAVKEHRRKDRRRSRGRTPPPPPPPRVPMPYR